MNIPERHADGTCRSTMKRPRFSHELQRSSTVESLVTALAPRARIASGLGTTSASTGNGQRCVQSRMRARSRPEFDTGAIVSQAIYPLDYDLPVLDNMARRYQRGADLVLSAEAPTPEWTERLGPAPDIYSPEINYWLLKAAQWLARNRPDIGVMYVHTTDYPMHMWPQEASESKRHLATVDGLLGEIAAAASDAAMLLTADHGMNAKPRVIYLEDVLAKAGIEGAQVVLPITDPYVVHHSALGSFAWVHLPQEARASAREALLAIAGVEDVLTREEAAATFEHPIDRIGDLSVTADARTALGKSEAKHDLSGLDEPLRSHGGPHEQSVPIIVSHPLQEAYAQRHQRGVRNADIHDLLPNGLE